VATITIIEKKQCTQCHKIKSVDEFGKQSSAKNNLHPWCKECNNKQTREYYQNHRTKRRKYSKEYRQVHESEIVEYRKEYNRTHKVEIAEHKKEYLQTLNGYLHQCFDGMLCRCTNDKYYNGQGIKVKFTFGEFFKHTTIDLGFDTYEKIKGLDIHRTKKHYEIGGIEFLTQKEHMAKHKKIKIERVL